MREKLKQIAKIGVFALVAALFVHHFPAFAKEILPIESSEYMRGGIPAPPSDVSGQKIAIDLLIAGLGYVKVLAVVVGILFLTIQGYRLVKSAGNEDEVTKAKKAIIYILIAFILISMSLDIAKFFDMSSGTIISSPSEILKRVHIFDKQVEVIMVFFKYVIGAYAGLTLTLAALSFVTSGGSEDAVNSAKRRIYFSVAGLLMLFLGEIAVTKVFYNVDKEVYSGLSGVKPYIDVPEGIAQIIGVTNFIVTFFGVLAILMLVIAAIMYASSAGNEESMQRAKRILIATVVSMLIIFGAYSVVSSVIAGRLGI